jgi:WD40 repeat protein
MSEKRFDHTATFLGDRDGSVLIAGGEQDTSVLTGSEIYDSSQQQFVRTGSLKRPRKNHTATLLNDGRVLVTGGDDKLTVTSSAEAFDPRSGGFKSVGGMIVPRAYHTATRLENGNVLIVGGSARIDSCGVPDSPLDSVEIFLPSRHKDGFRVGFFTAQEGRAAHTAILIKHGRKVLITGGIDIDGKAEATAELYDTRTGLFTFTSTMMGSPRYGHTATLLTDGSVLITGGYAQISSGAVGCDQSSQPPLSSAEIYSPKTDTFSPTRGLMIEARAFHTATRLANGQVLIVGGNTAGTLSDRDQDRTAEIYDPGSGTFGRRRPSPTQDAHTFQTATLLNGVEVLIEGGTVCCAIPPAAKTPLHGANQAELFDPRDASLSGTGSEPNQLDRIFHTATLLQNGQQILIVGGEDATIEVSRTAEVYNSRVRGFSPAGNLNQARALHTATLIKCAAPGCPNGLVLVAGGIGAGSNGSVIDLNSAELYDLGRSIFTKTGAMTTPRELASATALGDGRILIAGGEQQGPPAKVLDNAEIYDPIAGSFSCVGGVSETSQACNSTMTSARVLHSAVLLPDGTVLLAGGVDNSPRILETAELFDPKANDGMGAFTATLGTTPLRMHTARAAHTATGFTGGPLNGKVLIAGGSFDQSAELYDPGSGMFSCFGGTTGNPPVCNSVMQAVRFLHAATLLNDGMVLLTGGSFLNAREQLLPESSAEAFVPAGDASMGTFVPAAGMTARRALHTATLLDAKLVSTRLAGSVLITGGEGIDQTLESAELFTPTR